MRACFFLISLALAKQTLGQGTPAADQLEIYKNNTEPKTLTTTTGVPLRTVDVETLNTDVFSNSRFMEEITKLNRERIPVRVVHGKGTGAHGYLNVTHDVTNITNAALFSKVGKITPVFARISSAFSQKGSPDTLRGPFSIAAKFYTEEGNWDFLGFTTDTFFFKDAVLFPSAAHSLAFQNPRTGLPDANSQFDFLTINSEIMQTFLQFMGDMGVPASYRHISAHPLHTFQVENDREEVSFVRFKLTPDLGEKYLNQTQALTEAGFRPNIYTEDLYNAIENKQYPSWTLGMQVIPYDKVGKAGFDIFDLTLRWPLAKYPLKKIGKFILNRNPENQFSDTEQVALNPGNVVPGIQGCDQMFRARSFAYRDAHLYRLGANFNKIAINCPLSEVNTYQRDGHAPVRDNGKDAPNYYPNSFNGPAPVKATRTRTKAVTVRTNPEPTNYGQAADYYNSLPEDSRRRLVENLASALAPAYPYLQERTLNVFGEIDAGLRRDVEAGLAQVAAAAAT